MADRVVIFKEKHGNRVMKASDVYELERSMLTVVEERYDEGWYYNWDEGDLQTQWGNRARCIVEEGDGAEAVKLCYERQDHEYEGFEFSYVG